MHMKEVKNMKRNILLNPGPATTTNTVKQALITPDMCPREKQCGLLLEQIRKDLVQIVTNKINDYTCVLFAGSGTATMEACMCSVVPKGKTALIISNGAYGERFSDIASAHNIHFYRHDVGWGKGIDLEKVKYLIKTLTIGAVFVTHHETSTGILNDIKSIGEIVSKKGLPFIVDTVSSFAGIPFLMEDCNIDYCISTSNKCIQGIAGVSFVIAKKDSIKYCKPYYRSVYLDLYTQWRSLEEKKQGQFTVPIQVLNALKQAIDEYFQEGGQNRYERYCNNHAILVAGMKRRGFKQFLSDDVTHSCILETFYEPKGFNFEEVHDKLLQRGFIIYPGKLLNENTFRLAVMGDLYEEDILDFLLTLDEVMR